MESFGNNTELKLALYDTTGIRLENARVAGGKDVCMCFAMSRAISSFTGALCLYIDGMGYGWVRDWTMAESYRPNAAKSMPICKNVNVDDLKSQWSATAFKPTFSERVSTVAGLQTSTDIVSSTPITSSK